MIHWQSAITRNMDRIVPIVRGQNSVSSVCLPPISSNENEPVRPGSLAVLFVELRGECTAILNRICYVQTNHSWHQAPPIYIIFNNYILLKNCMLLNNYTIHYPLHDTLVKQLHYPLSITWHVSQTITLSIIHYMTR